MDFIKEELMTNLINYVPGKGKENKAVYLVGTEKVPAAVITRLLNNLSGMTGPKLDRSFYQGLSKYPRVLDALDAYSLAPVVAVESFKHLQEQNRVEKTSAQKRASKVEKAAEVFAKGICKRFKGAPEEMVAAFLEIVSKTEFKNEVTDIVAAYEKNFGRSTMGYIKTSKRKGNPAAQKALAKMRIQKAKKK
ncbi:MAG TPA: hypothetical protein VN436_07395 [Holophaga sp.]|nr:hypothetical protein [Holophaga sp.]